MRRLVSICCVLLLINMSGGLMPRALARIDTMKWSELLEESNMVVAGGVLSARVLSEWSRRGVRTIELRLIPDEIFARHDLPDIDGSIAIFLDAFVNHIPVGSEGIFFLRKEPKGWKVIDNDFGQWRRVSRSCKREDGSRVILDSYSLGVYAPQLTGIDPEVLTQRIDCSTQEGFAVIQDEDGGVSIGVVDRRKLHKLLAAEFERHLARRNTSSRGRQ